LAQKILFDIQLPNPGVGFHLLCLNAIFACARRWDRAIDDQDRVDAFGVGFHAARQPNYG